VGFAFELQVLPYLARSTVADPFPCAENKSPSSLFLCTKFLRGRTAEAWLRYSRFPAVSCSYENRSLRGGHPGNLSGTAIFLIYLVFSLNRGTLIHASLILQLLQDEFVLMRQKDSTVSVELYRSWLTLARLLALSYGETTLTANRWEYTKSLEQTRLDRVKQVNQFRDSVT
jgi:hypothetical protein